MKRGGSLFSRPLRDSHHVYVITRHSANATCRATFGRACRHSRYERSHHKRPRAKSQSQELFSSLFSLYQEMSEVFEGFSALAE